MTIFKCFICGEVGKGVRLFWFPISEERCQKWIDNLQLDTTVKIVRRKKKLCEIHFTNSSFRTEDKAKLNTNAEPTILCSDPLDISDVKNFTQPDSSSNNVATSSTTNVPVKNISNSTQPNASLPKKPTQIQNITPKITVVPTKSLQSSKKVYEKTPTLKENLNKNQLQPPAINPRNGDGKILQYILVNNGKDDDVSIIEPPEEVVDLCDDDSNVQTLKIEETTETEINNEAASTSETKDGETSDCGPIASPSVKEIFSLTPENISKVCRACLKEKDVINLHENSYDGKSFGQLLELSSGIKLQEDPNLSQNICNSCLAELLQSYHFRLKCEKSNIVLHNYEVEMEKAKQRIAELEKLRCHTLRFHDYENPLTENDIKSMNRQLEELSKSKKRRNLSDDDTLDTNIENEQEADSTNAEQPVKKRFYLLKGDLSGKGGNDGKVNVTEINEDNAKSLISNNNKAIQLKVGNSICNIRTAAKNKGLVNPVTIKNLLNKRRRLLPFSQILKPLNSYMDGQILSTNYSVKRRKPRKIKPPKEPKPKDKKPSIPGECHICKEPWTTMEEYRQHSKTTKHYLNPYPCKLCENIYPNKYRLNFHVSVKHDPSRSYMCEVCGKCYKTRSYLLKHVSSHSQEGYRCRICGLHSDTLRAIVHHNKTTHLDVERRHCCEFCGEFFARKDSLRHHRNRLHLKIEHVFCHICGKGYQYKSHLRKHMKTHSTQQFDCKLCNRTFKAENRYREHLRTQHPGADENTDQDVEIQVMECLYCELLCRNKQLQSMHIREDHNISICLYCDEQFESVEQLEKHRASLHATIEDFSCRYCGKIFPEAPQLFAHLDTHRTKTVQCQQCFKKFANTMRLKIHMVIHTREKKYQCRYCESSFLYNTSRTIHERVHTGERPYVCDICNKGCVCISSYKRHRRTHFFTPSTESEIKASVENLLSMKQEDKTNT